jgi:plastocyanin
MKLLRVLVLAAIAGGLSACGGGSSAPATTVAPNSITIKNIAYNPSNLTIKVGDTVTWLFKDGGVPHNVDGKASQADLYSGSPQTGGSYHYTFTKAGTYHFVCDVHSSMTGTITVS